MILVYRPEGQEEQRWEFQLGRLRTAECEAIERRTGLDYDTEFREKLLKGNIRARRALLWTMLRRTHHTIRYEDVDFAAAEVVLEFDLGEYQAMRDELAKAPGVDDDQRAMALAVLDAEIARLSDEPSEGKAESGGSETATG